MRPRRRGRHQEEKAVAKAELGAKRRCLSCGAAFFDLNREPIACPKCDAIFQVVELPRSLPRRGAPPYRSAPNGARIGDQPSGDEVSSTEETETEIDAEEADEEEAEADDSVPPPIDDDDKIEEIDDLL
ncbi:TIGR02300 family protein [Methylosinus sp. LW4]|uniref:TIGR02300 family protein n=1 Tax=Methylosinus sp. LW4 TaxID=136993 RepID=UPI001FDA8691|nr:TIGR02300 family protein [Methylosinus sp. LW4]